MALAYQGAEPWAAGNDALEKRVEGSLTGAPAARYQTATLGSDNVFISCWTAQHETLNCLPDYSTTVVTVTSKPDADLEHTKFLHCPLGEIRNHDAVLDDGEAALTNALYWYTHPTGAYATAAREAARAILNRWSSATIGTLNTSTEICWAASLNHSKGHIAEQSSGLLLAADIMMSGGSSVWPEAQAFRNWVRSVVVKEATDSHDGNVSPDNDEWGPYGQNHGAWALYTNLLAAYVLEDSALFNKWQTNLKTFIANAVDDPGRTVCQFNPQNGYGSLDSCHNDGTLGNERGRYGSGLEYTKVSLRALTSGLLVVKNATGTNLFDTATATGKQIRVALQSLYYFNRHNDTWPYNWDQRVLSPIKQTNAGDLFEAMAAIYNSSDYLEYSKVYYLDPDNPDSAPEPVPHNTYVMGHVWQTYQHGSFTLNPAAASIDKSAPPTHTFEAGPGPFLASNAYWSVEAERNNPAGNKVYRLSSLSTQSTSTYGDREWLNYNVRAKVKLYGTPSTSARVGLLAHYFDSRNYYSFVWSPTSTGGRLKILKTVNNVTTELAGTSLNLTPNVWYTFNVQVDGPDLRVSVPLGLLNTVSVSARDFEFLGGKVALHSNLADAVFDNVCVSRNGGTCVDAENYLTTSLITAGALQ